MTEAHDSDDSRSHGTGPDASALAADALRLLGTAQEWARRTFGESGVTAEAVGRAESHASGHTGPECQWCPLCQFVAVLRGERPELTERVAEAGAALTAALRAALDAATHAAPPGQHRADERPPRPARVQRIDLGGSGTDDAGAERAAPE